MLAFLCCVVLNAWLYAKGLGKLGQLQRFISGCRNSPTTPLGQARLWDASSTGDLSLGKAALKQTFEDGVRGAHAAILCDCA